jgi:hypothetical protein
MRLTNKGPFTGVLAFLPIVLVLGCSRSPDGGKPVALGPLPGPEEQFVGVTLVGTEVKWNVNPVQLYRGKGHVAHWVFCGGEGDLKITMKGNDPFETSVEHSGKHARSGKPKSGLKGQKFSYWITVTTPTGTYKSTDPDIEIMD